MDFQVKKGGIVSDLIKKANLIQKKKKYKKFCRVKLDDVYSVTLDYLDK